MYKRQALEAKAGELAGQGKTPLVFAKDGKLAGMIAVADVIKEDSAKAIKELQNMGIEVVMVTGDNQRTAEAIGRQAGVDKVVAGVLPEGKETVIRELQKAGGLVAMVGDGINDSPALSEADAGVAIAEGADIAREIADITISAHDLRQLVVLKQISTLLMKRVNFNYDFVVSFNAGLIGLGVMGILPPATTALLHNGSTIAISLHSMTDLMEA